jgi:STE24 endopeptidase
MSASAAKEYQNKKQRVRLLGLGLTPLGLFLILVTPVSSVIESYSASRVASPYGILAFYFLALSVLWTLWEFPLAVYSGFLLERRYGLTRYRFTGWLRDFLKQSGLAFTFFLILLEGLYSLIWHFQNKWWLCAWAGFAIVSYGVGKLMPVVIVPLFYRYSAVGDGVLKERIRNLVSRFGFNMKDVYALNLSRTTKKANAALMGIGKTKRVVLSDTLLENFNHDEIEAVVAHELGHHRHHDIWRHMAFGLVTSFVTFWLASQILDAAARALGYDGQGDLAAMPVLLLVFYGVSLILTPLQNGFSRWMERQADQFALEAGPGRVAFVACMQKLAEINMADPDPNPFYEWFFYDHPSVGKRIKMAEQGS